MAKVALVRCESYEYQTVLKAVQKGIALLGGPAVFAKPSEKILLKPNLLAADPPEKCTTTHPAVFEAVAEVIKGTGCQITYGDSPGIHSPEAAAKKAGLAAVASKLEIPLADFNSGQEILFKEALQNKRFTIASGVLESDGLISLPKLKTHAFAKMTGCIKNQFGCIPGPRKAEFHVKLPNVLDFAKMLVDLCSFVKPRLYVMDGIIGMEGNGPRSGSPKQMNLLLFSADPVALDATVCRLIGLDPEFVPTIKIGQEAGLGRYSETEIELLGDPLASFTDLQFDIKREPLQPYKPKGGVGFLRNALISKPYINAGKCIKCGVCAQVCPVNPKAVDWHDGNKAQTPAYKYERCIRCFCCQELCPESAIDLKVPLVRSLFTKKRN